MAKKSVTDPSFAAVQNERELSKDPTDITAAMNSSFFRDQLFESNAERMFKVNQTLKRSYFVTLISQLIIAYVMLIGFFYKFLHTFYSVISLPGSEQYITSGCLINFPVALLGIAMTVIANRWFNRNCNIVLLICMVIYGATGLFAMAGMVDDIGRLMGIFMFAAGIWGAYRTNKTREAFDELDYLVTQEGFPTFNSAMFSMHRSRYVRYREKWENKHTGGSTGYSEYEKPTENIIVTAAEKPDEMDGISADNSSCEEWFENSKIKSAEKKEEVLAENAMNDLAYSSEVSEEQNFYEEQADPVIKKIL